MNVFFYGLFMDADLLARKGVRAAGPRVARLDGYALVLGARATLVPAAGETVYGVVMDVPADDLARLYADPSVGAYRPEPVRAVLDDGRPVEAVCYNLPRPLEPGEPNRAYARQLRDLAERLGFPGEYLATIERVGA